MQILKKRTKTHRTKTSKQTNKHSQECFALFHDNNIVAKEMGMKVYLIFGASQNVYKNQRKRFDTFCSNL